MMHQDFNLGIGAFLLSIGLFAASLPMLVFSDKGDVTSPSPEGLEDRLYEYHDMVASIPDDVGDKILHDKLGNYVTSDLLSYLSSKAEFPLQKQVRECSMLGMFECHTSIEGVLHISYKGRYCSALIGKSATMDLVTTVYWDYEITHYKIAMVNVKYFDQWFEDSERAIAAVASTCSQVWPEFDEQSAGG